MAREPRPQVSALAVLRPGSTTTTTAPVPPGAAEPPHAGFAALEMAGPAMGPVLPLAVDAALDDPLNAAAAQELPRLRA